MPQAPTLDRPLAIPPAEARAIARDAYVYGFPLVDSYRVQYSYFVDAKDHEFKGAWNEVHNTARVYTPEDKAIQTPNSDTPYSFLGCDLRAEPLVIGVPKITGDRYYALQFIDMYTHVFAYVGTRATGSEAASYLLAGPGWSGETPPGIKAVIRCETEFAFILYRTQLFGPDDIDNVKKVQAGYRVEPLSHFLGQHEPDPPPAVDFMAPLSREEEQSSPKVFEVLNFVLQFCPTVAAETGVMERFARLGVGAGQGFDAGTLSPELRQAVEAGIKDAWADLEVEKGRLDRHEISSGDLFGDRARLNGDYLARMAGAALGIYGNAKDEAIYPPYFLDAGGRPLNGGYRYSLRFAPDGLPPVEAFWSLTLYEMPQSLLYANKLNRYLINSPMLPQLTRDADGGITLYIQHDSPGADREANWLPAPAGPFGMAMRLYAPKPAAFDGSWKAPPLVRAETVTVTPDNFVRAETDMYFSHAAKDAGGAGRVFHHRDPMPIDAQSVIRANRDTLYSAAVFDLDAGPVTFTLPDAGSRFMSLMALNEDHYICEVAYDARPHVYTRDKVGTRYMLIGVRTLVDPADPADVKTVHALQDAIKVEQAAVGALEIPSWDPDSQGKVRKALLALNETLPDSRGMFGSKDQVDPVRHLIGSASAWGGNPETEAFYLTVTPERNDGKTVYRLKVPGDVPVDGFWSISVYNKDGYFEPNPQNAYSLNNITARKAGDGSVDIQFGGEAKGAVNVLPITPGWNYLARLYRPRAEVLDGRWTFPEAQPIA